MPSGIYERSESNVDLKGWTLDAITYVQDHWATKSASEIMQELKDQFGLIKSRNAVIGKAHRLGLSAENKKRKSHKKYTAVNRRIGREPAKPRTPTPSLKQINEARDAALKAMAIGARQEAERIAKEEAEAMKSSVNVVPFMQRSEQQCAWPVASSGATMMVCGNKVRSGVYCAHHDRAGHQFTKTLKRTGA